MKKDFAIILFLLVLIAPFAGTYLYIHHQKNLIKKQFKKQIIAGIDKNKLVFLRFATDKIETKLRWEHSKEFEYENQMYDVVESKNVGDSIYFWCWWDNDETQLNKHLKELVNYTLGNNSQNKKKQEQLINFIKNLYFQRTFECTISSPDLLISQSSNYLNLYSSLSIPPKSPPPRQS